MKYLTLIIITIASAAFFLIALANNNDSAARRAYAQAAIVREQSQARSDLLAAMLPYVAMTAIIVTCAAMTAIIIYSLSRLSTTQKPMRIIETRTILVLQPGQHSRREIYRLLTDQSKRRSDTYIGLSQ